MVLFRGHNSRTTTPHAIAKRWQGVNAVVAAQAAACARGCCSAWREGSSSLLHVLLLLLLLLLLNCFRPLSYSNFFNYLKQVYSPLLAKVLAQLEQLSKRKNSFLSYL
jgi:hypothetical protein